MYKLNEMDEYDFHSIEYAFRDALLDLIKRTRKTQFEYILCRHLACAFDAHLKDRDQWCVDSKTRTVFLTEENMNSSSNIRVIFVSDIIFIDDEDLDNHVFLTEEEIQNAHKAYIRATINLHLRPRNTEHHYLVYDVKTRKAIVCER